MGTKDSTQYFPGLTKTVVDNSVNGGSVIPSSSSGQVSFVRTRTGSALPNWRTIIAKGGNATTGLTARYERGFATPGKVRAQFYGVSGNPNKLVSIQETTIGDPLWTGSTLGRISPKAPSLSTTFADNAASAKFYKALRQQAVQWSAPTFIGELGEAMRMVRRPAAALWDSAYGYLGALSKRKRASPKHWTKAISGLWLEYSFGWVPLIKDAEDAQKALERLVTGGNRKTVISGSYSDERDTSSTIGTFWRWQSGVYFNTGNNLYWRPNHSVLREKCVVRYKAKVEHKTDMTKWDNWALFGFTPSELVPTAWELLPWSFLVDYFVNVGDVLNSWVTDAKSVSFVNKTVVRYTEWKGGLVFDPESSRKSLSIYCSQCLPTTEVDPEWELHRKDVTRSAGSSVPLPRLQTKFSLGDGQLLNVAALLGQARALHSQSNFPHFRR